MKESKGQGKGVDQSTNKLDETSNASFVRKAILATQLCTLI